MIMNSAVRKGMHDKLWKNKKEEEKKSQLKIDFKNNPSQRDGPGAIGAGSPYCPRQSWE
jgi:hypothetical protein